MYIVSMRDFRRCRVLVMSRLYDGCALCGDGAAGSEPLSELLFHHVHPSQKEFDLPLSNLRPGRFGTMEKFVAELDKCVVLCWSCHLPVHNARNIDPIILPMHIARTPSNRAFFEMLVRARDL
jgi:hypothetical protein